MTFRTLFQFAIKVYGLFILKDIFLIVGSSVTLLLKMRGQTTSLGDTVDVMVYSQFTYLIVYLILFYFLVFRTERVANLFLSGDKLGEKELNIHVHRHTVITAVIFLLSFGLIVDGLENFLQNLISYFNQMRPMRAMFLTTYVLPNLALAVLGIVLCFNAARIANLFEKNRRKANIN